MLASHAACRPMPPCNPTSQRPRLQFHSHTAFMCCHASALTAMKKNRVTLCQCPLMRTRAALEPVTKAPILPIYQASNLRKNAQLIRLLTPSATPSR